jgi:50S ribosomal protein L16 3-hydroxylase
MKKRLLAGLSAREFMRRNWQKAPLFARGALPQYALDRSTSAADPRIDDADRAITKQTLFALASSDAVESRIVTRTATTWHLRHGPFTRRELSRLPPRDWTLLVQGVDQSLRQAEHLMREFSFIPHARLDDVMVSYAAPGGGVGAHFDSYDVFLLQGLGRRRWRIGRQRDLALVPDLPVKILRRFAPEQEWIVQPGDLLYLPPHYAHEGVAIDVCITYSIGFRAPAAQELAQAFLELVQDEIDLDGRYADPAARAVSAPGTLPRAMIDYAQSTLERLRWSRGDVERFLGRYLTEPKANVVFDPPRRPLAAAAFASRARACGIRLALPSRMLVSGRAIYLNGEALRPPAAARPALGALADTRELIAGAIDPSLAELLYPWYRAGYIALKAAKRGSRQAPRANRSIEES